MIIFEFEQSLFKCNNVLDDIKLLVERNAKPEEFDALRIVYQHRFDDTLDQFEQVAHEYHLAKRNEANIIDELNEKTFR